MAAPSKSWVDISNGLIDSDSTINTDSDVLEKLRDQLVYLQEIIVNDTSYTGPLPHEHDGTNDTEATPMPCNLVLEANPYTELGLGNWTASSSVGSGTEEDNPAGWLVMQMRKNGGRGTNGDYFYQDLFGGSGEFLFGYQGSQVVLSMFIRMTDQSTAGKVSIGCSDASTSFVTGHKGQVDHSELSTGWKRVFVVLDEDHSSSGYPFNKTTYATGCRLLVKIEESFDAGVGVWICGLCLQPGRSLMPFTFCPIDSAVEGFGFQAVQGVPLFDPRVSLEEAIQLTAV